MREEHRGKEEKVKESKGREEMRGGEKKRERKNLVNLSSIIDCLLFIQAQPALCCAVVLFSSVLSYSIFLCVSVSRQKTHCAVFWDLEKSSSDAYSKV